MKPSGTAGEYAVLIFRICATRAPRAIRHHIVAMDPVEGLLVHPDQPRGARPVHPVQRVGDRVRGLLTGGLGG
jgi:hypothetical protein